MSDFFPAAPYGDVGFSKIFASTGAPAPPGPTIINGAIGAASATGLAGFVGFELTIVGSTGTAVADGLPGEIVAPIFINGGIGNALAQGLPGMITFPIPFPPDVFSAPAGEARLGLPVAVEEDRLGEEST